VVGEAEQEVHIGLFPQQEGEIGFEVYTPGTDGEAVVHCQGQARLNGLSETLPALDLAGLQRQCTQRAAPECDGQRYTGCCWGIAVRRPGIVRPALYHRAWSPDPRPTNESVMGPSMFARGERIGGVSIRCEWAPVD
jgi:hypothetical protein